jgi:hypothetical protein
MAIVRGNHATYNSGTGNVTTVPVAKPDGVVEGTFLLAFIGTNAGIGGILEVPEGWTEIPAAALGRASVEYKAYYKVAGASEPASYTWNTISDQASGAIIAFTGVAGLINTASANSGSSATATFSGSTILTDACLLLAAVCYYNTSERTASTPTDFSDVLHVGRYQHQTIFERSHNAGAYADFTSTLSASCPYVALTVALSPVQEHLVGGVSLNVMRSPEGVGGVSLNVMELSKGIGHVSLYVMEMPGAPAPERRRLVMLI